MRVRRLIIMFALLGGAFLSIGAGDAPSEEDRSAQPPCEPLYDHMMGLFQQNEDFVAKFSELTAEDKAAQKAEFVTMCGEVTDASEIAVSWCIMGATTFEGLEACLASKKESLAKRLGRADALANLDGIRIAEKAYHAAFDHYVPCDWTPAEIPKAPVDFEGPGKAAFEQLGWVPWGQVLCRYRVTVQPGATGGAEDATFEATAECDLDGDGAPMVLRSTGADKAAAVTPEEIL